MHQVVRDLLQILDWRVHTNRNHAHFVLISSAQAHNSGVLQSSLQRHFKPRQPIFQANLLRRLLSGVKALEAQCQCQINNFFIVIFTSLYYSDFSLNKHTIIIVDINHQTN